STLLPYTTLFRSEAERVHAGERLGAARLAGRQHRAAGVAAARHQRVVAGEEPVHADRHVADRGLAGALAPVRLGHVGLVQAEADAPHRPADVLLADRLEVERHGPG